MVTWPTGKETDPAIRGTFARRDMDGEKLNDERRETAYL
jgi:hypothetical protein